MDIELGVLGYVNGSGLSAYGEAHTVRGAALDRGGIVRRRGAAHGSDDHLGGAVIVDGQHKTEGLGSDTADIRVIELCGHFGFASCIIVIGIVEAVHEFVAAAHSGIHADGHIRCFRIHEGRNDQIHRQCGGDGAGVARFILVLEGVGLTCQSAEGELIFLGTVGGEEELTVTCQNRGNLGSARAGIQDIVVLIVIYNVCLAQFLIDVAYLHHTLACGLCVGGDGDQAVIADRDGCLGGIRGVNGADGSVGSHDGSDLLDVAGGVGIHGYRLVGGLGVGEADLNAQLTEQIVQAYGNLDSLTEQVRCSKYIRSLDRIAVLVLTDDFAVIGDHGCFPGVESGGKVTFIEIFKHISRTVAVHRGKRCFAVKAHCAFGFQTALRIITIPPVKGLRIADVKADAAVIPVVSAFGGDVTVCVVHVYGQGSAIAQSFPLLIGDAESPGAEDMDFGHCLHFTGPVAFFLRHNHLSAENTVVACSKVLPDSIGAVLVLQKLAVFIQCQRQGHRQPSVVAHGSVGENLGIRFVKGQRNVTPVNAALGVSRLDGEEEGITRSIVAAAVAGVNNRRVQGMGGVRIQIYRGRIAVDGHNTAVIMEDRELIGGNIALRIQHVVFQIHYVTVVGIAFRVIVAVGAHLAEIILALVILVRSIQRQGFAHGAHGPDFGGDGILGALTVGQLILQGPNSRRIVYVDDDLLGGDHAVGSLDFVYDQVPSCHEGQLRINGSAVGLGVLSSQVRQIGGKVEFLAVGIVCLEPQSRIGSQLSRNIVAVVVHPDPGKILGAPCIVAVGTGGAGEGNIGFLNFPSIGSGCQTQLDLLAAAVGSFNVGLLPLEALTHTGTPVAVGFAGVIDGDIQRCGIHEELVDFLGLGGPAVGVGNFNHQTVPAVVHAQTGLEGDGLGAVAGLDQIPGLDEICIGHLVALGIAHIVQLKGGIALAVVQEFQTVALTQGGSLVGLVGDLNGHRHIVQILDRGHVTIGIVELPLRLGIGLALCVGDGYGIDGVVCLVGKVDGVHIDHGFGSGEAQQLTLVGIIPVSGILTGLHIALIGIAVNLVELRQRAGGGDVDVHSSIVIIEEVLDPLKLVTQVVRSQVTEFGRIVLHIHSAVCHVEAAGDQASQIYL